MVGRELLPILALPLTLVGSKVKSCSRSEPQFPGLMSLLHVWMHSSGISPVAVETPLPSPPGAPGPKTVLDQPGEHPCGPSRRGPQAWDLPGSEALPRAGDEAAGDGGAEVGGQ